MTQLRSSSLHGTTLDALMNHANQSCTVGLEVENQTDWKLVSPFLFGRQTTVTTPPQDILPGYKEVMVAAKQSGSVRGTWGSVSWLVQLHDETKQRRIVVMWSNPYNYNHYVNTLAIGITSSGVTEPQESWTDAMYNAQPIDDMQVQRGEYYNEVHQITVEDDLLHVTGNMSNDHRAKVLIDVRLARDHDRFQLPVEVAPASV